MPKIGGLHGPALFVVKALRQRVGQWPRSAYDQACWRLRVPPHPPPRSAGAASWRQG